ncbi:RNA polymerase sporulation sigma factor SigK [Amedibacillus sp. YH-ame10]
MFTTIFEVLSNALCYVGYIRSNSFAQPLDKQDEEKFIELLSKNDEEARNKLIEHNLRLVAHIVKKYDFKKEQTEDLISIGTIGLIKAIDSFKPEKGHKLTTYASKCIENEILMYLRSSKNYFQNVSLNEPIATDKDGSEIMLIDAISSPETTSIIDDMMVADNIEKLKRFIHVLDNRELEIVTKRFGLYGQEELTQREIAKQLRISRSYVSRIEKRAFMKIYREFQKEDKKKDRKKK